MPTTFNLESTYCAAIPAMYNKRVYFAEIKHSNMQTWSSTRKTPTKGSHASHQLSMLITLVHF